MISKAQGCLLGQFGGDALGNPVEFEKPSSILRKFPNGLRAKFFWPVDVLEVATALLEK